MFLVIRLYHSAGKIHWVWSFDSYRISFMFNHHHHRNHLLLRRSSIKTQNAISDIEHCISSWNNISSFLMTDDFPLFAFVRLPIRTFVATTSTSRHWTQATTAFCLININDSARSTYSSVHWQSVSCCSCSFVEQSSIARHCCLSIFCCRLKSHLFSLSYSAFWLFSHLYSARAASRHFGHSIVVITLNI